MSSAIAALSLDAAPGVETQITRPFAFTVPLADNDEFVMLSAKRRHEVNVTLRILERVHALRGEPNWVAAVNTLATGYRHMGGFSAVTIRRKYSDYIKSGGDWRTCVKGFAPPSQQPAKFKEFIKGLIEVNHRSAETALNKLREELWPSGVEIPGYGTWESFFAANYPDQPVPTRFPRIWPEGWSIRNMRRYGPTRAEIELFQGGYAAAHGSLPTVRRDPSKLRPMEWIVIDDFQLDVMCYFKGDTVRGLKPQVAYSGGLMAKCVGTRKKLALLFGPMVDREVQQPDGTKKTVRSYVSQLDVQGLLYTVFRDNGLPKEYEVTIICENRTATITPAMELMLQTVFGGRIRVRRTSLIDHKTLTNGFGESGGTPWEKGWIESDFNYLWNQLADQKGYKGSNERLNAPGDLAAKIKDATRLLGQGQRQLNLPPELIDELALPFMSVEQLEAAFNFVIERAERRTKHRFLGFQTITEFRWPNPALPAPQGIDPHATNNFRSLALLAPEQQALMVPEERKESIIERWERLGAENVRVRLNPGTLALFLLTPNKATFRNHSVTFTRDGTGYSYIDDEGVLPADLPDRTDLLAYVDFNNPGSAAIHRTDGTFLGVLRMLGGSPRGVDITDVDAMAEARALRAKVVNRVLARVRARPLHQQANALMGEERARNGEIVAAWQSETAQLPAADRMAQAMGEAARTHDAERRRVQPTTSSHSLDDLMPAQGDDGAAKPSLSDLL